MKILIFLLTKCDDDFTPRTRNNRNITFYDHQSAIYKEDRHLSSNTLSDTPWDQKMMKSLNVISSKLMYVMHQY